MRLATWYSKTVWVVTLLTAAGCGCCEKEKQQIQALQAQNDDLMSERADLSDRLSEQQAFTNSLRAELSDTNQQLSNARQTIAELESQPRQTETADDWERGRFGDKITVGSDLLFASGKATLTSAGTQKLAKIASDLKSTYADLPVRVYGYTDSDPIKKTKNLWQDNLDLSANRAMAVTRYLTGQGIDAERVETIAMGATNFKASNQSKEGKAQNRRVEIFVVRSAP